MSLNPKSAINSTKVIVDTMNAAQKNKPKIFIVEDDPLNMKLFKDLLELKKIEVICINDGNKVLGAISTEHPDLILMDIRLNDVSGISIIEEIKKQSDIKHIPIIALTAFAMKQDKERIMKSGCEGYMPKPIAIDDFFKEIGRFIKIE